MVSSILEHTTIHGAIEGKTQEIKVRYYNLDAIISVGYRANSTQATAFRIWATERLKEYIIKGFTMDDERLKNPNNIFGRDYFEEQLAPSFAFVAQECKKISLKPRLCQIKANQFVKPVRDAK